MLARESPTFIKLYHPTYEVRGEEFERQAPRDDSEPLMRRMQDSNFREVQRVTNLPLKIKRQEWRIEALKVDEKRGRVSRDLLQKKGVNARKPKSTKSLSHLSKRS
jgi:hypothetical protein